MQNLYESKAQQQKKQQILTILEQDFCQKNGAFFEEIRALIRKDIDQIRLADYIIKLVTQFGSEKLVNEGISLYVKQFPTIEFNIIDLTIVRKAV